MSQLVSAFAVSALVAAVVPVAHGSQSPRARETEYVPIHSAALRKAASDTLLQSADGALRFQWASALSPAKPLPPVRSYQGDMSIGQLADGRYFRLARRHVGEEHPSISSIKLSPHKDGLGLKNGDWEPEAAILAGGAPPTIPGYRHLASRSLKLREQNLGIWEAIRGKPSLILVTYEQASGDRKARHCLVASSPLTSASFYLYQPFHSAGSWMLELIGNRRADRRIYLLSYSFDPRKLCDLRGSPQRSAISSKP